MLITMVGGIGTYIKSPYQTQLEVGDPSNDSVRVDSNLVNAKVIGEGANLGITQEARFHLIYKEDVSILTSLIILLV